MASNAPITGAPTRAPLRPQFALANRRTIENEIERLISLLDEHDAPFADLEPEEDQSPEEHWGEGQEEYSTLPLYGADQSAGPLNEVAAHRVYMRQFVEARP